MTPFVAPSTGTIFMSKLEFRDLSYSSIKQWEKKGRLYLSLKVLDQENVDGPKKDGVDGWTMPLVNSADDIPEEDQAQITIWNHGEHYIDEGDTIFDPWDGKPSLTELFKTSLISH